MKRRSKYFEQIIDGKWKVIDYKDRKYILENIYNHQICEIRDNYFIKVIRGKSSVSKIISYRIIKSKDKNNFCYRKLKGHEIKRLSD